MGLNNIIGWYNNVSLVNYNLLSDFSYVSMYMLCTIYYIVALYNKKIYIDLKCSIYTNIQVTYHVKIKTILKLQKCLILFYIQSSYFYGIPLHSIADETERKRKYFKTFCFIHIIYATVPVIQHSF